MASSIENSIRSERGGSEGVKEEGLRVIGSSEEKCMGWMPRRSQAKKDVAACEKRRGVGKRA